VENKVSGGELKGEWTGLGLRRKSVRSSLEAQNALPLILVAFSCRIAMVEPPDSYLESTVPAAACERAISVGSAGRACFARRVLSLRPPSTSYAISSGLHRYGKKKDHWRRAERSR
jgi:hypothetical protein